MGLELANTNSLTTLYKTCEFSFFALLCDIYRESIFEVNFGCLTAVQKLRTVELQNQ